MEIVRLTPAHAAEYRAHMLAAYAEDPDAFTATVEERAALPLDFWSARVSDDPEAREMIFGVFTGERLAGVAGLRFFRRPGTRHKAWLFGMAVSPEHRRRGLGRALVEAALERAGATPGVRLVQLTVSRVNAPAVRLYESCGFRPWGTEPRAVRVDDRLLARVHMWRPVDREDDSRGEAAPVAVRAAEARDREPLSRLRAALWPSDTASAHAGELLRYFDGQAREPQEILVAEAAEGELVGFCELSIRAYAEGCSSDRVGYLEGWYVAPGMRRRGIGRALVAGAEDWARGRGCTEFASDAADGNAVSAAAHAALGFADLGRIRCFRKDL